MADEINIRKGNAADWGQLAAVFHEAVRHDAVAYTEAQRAAWSPKNRAGPDWSLRLSRQSVQIAETVSDGPVGFMTAELNGYLDCAYILGRVQGQGIFRRLHTLLEDEQRALGIERMYTYASLHARPAFAAIGYRVIRPETVDMGGGVWLPRFAMEKIF